MTAIILFCFGTLDTRTLTNAQFFAGVSCLTEVLECARGMRALGYGMAEADEICLMGEKR